MSLMFYKNYNIFLLLGKLHVLNRKTIKNDIFIPYLPREVATSDYPEILIHITKKNNVSTSNYLKYLHTNV